MVDLRQSRDVPQIMLSVLFLAIMIIACLWVVQPFILGFAPGGHGSDCHRPLLLRLQRLLFGRRSLAVLVMMLLLILLFIIPVALLVNSPGGLQRSGDPRGDEVGRCRRRNWPAAAQHSARWRQALCRLA